MILLAAAQAQQVPAARSAGAAQQTPAPLIPAPVQVPPPQAPPQRATLKIVVLDPAHGGTDPGARGTGGMRESEMVLSLAAQIRAALEKQGFSVLQTRQGNDNPSFDDRAAMANAQRGAVFVTLHIGSTGLPGSVRVYTLPDFPAAAPAPDGLLAWDRAQAAVLPLSRKFAELAQAEFAQRFKGSPGSAQTAPVRQLRSLAVPAIAVELSSVSVEDSAVLEQMGPGVASAIARAVAEFKAVYDAAPVPGARP
ncbi:MAG: N-acetylmuramoyl-L-alanine amidase [Acidobacteriia bacterium]|nr:N-acetylmuramoyl-L-alanine amidase [Terriglobia bacterium]